MTTQDSNETADDRAAAQHGSVERAPKPPLRARLFGSIFFKAALVALLGNLLIAFFGYKFVSQDLQEIAAVEREQAGLAYISSVWPVYQMAIAGRMPPPSVIENLNAAGERYDPLFVTAAQRQQFLAASIAGADNAVDAGRLFIARIADNAGLSVDPDLNTLRAVDIVAVNLPDVAASALLLFHELTAMSSAAEHAAALDHFEGASRLLNDSLAATDALNFNTELTAQLGAAQVELSRATRQLKTAAMAALPGTGIGPGTTTLSEAHDRFQLSLSAFWQTSADALGTVLANRIAYLRGGLMSELGVSLGVYIAILLLGWRFTRSVRLRMRSLMAAVNRMREGFLDGPVPHTKNRDEIGDLSRAVDVFRQGLIEKRASDEAVQRQNRLLTEQGAALSVQNVRFDATLNNMRQGLAMFDKDRHLAVWNRRFAEIYRIEDGDLRQGVGYDDIRGRISARGRLADNSRSSDDVFARGQDGEYILELMDGRVLYVSHAAMPDGGLVTTHEDITERRRAEAKITYMALHDALTMLPNRALLRERLDEALAELAPGRSMAMLHVGLDNFKNVNDALGHDVGDALLKLASERLLSCVKEDALVARLSGDEFAILLPGARRGAETVANRILKRLSTPYTVETHQIAVGCSIGVAIAPEHGDDGETLLKNADLALYRAKSDGRGTFRLFEPDMDAELQRQRLLEIDLRQALANEEFEIYYQPIIDFASDRVGGFEALLRWHHPSRGMVQPGDFIPLAESTGLIVPIGEWVLRHACAEAATWPDDIKIAVNLSPTQFKNRNLIGVVMSALSASQIRPARLELEVTESLLLQDNEATMKTLHQLRSLGVRIAMDDFGTGYSSLSYLRSFPFDKIKVDKSFVFDLSEEEGSLAIVRAVVGLGKSLGIRTTAEGVETPHQLRILREMGYDEVQGMLFSAPRPSSEIPRLLGKREWRRIAVA